MKKLLLLLIAFCLPAHAVTLIDQTTTHTNFNEVDGWAWYSGTNGAFTLIRSNLASTGDSPLTAWGKANSNFTELASSIVSNADWVTNSATFQTKSVPVLSTNLYPGASNYLGTVDGFWSYTLNQFTNCDPLTVWYADATMTGTNYDPAPVFDYGTNGYYNLTNTLPTNTIWLAIATSNSVPRSGQLAWLSVNGSQVYSNYSSSPVMLGLFTNVTSFTLDQYTNFSPVDLYGSVDGTSYWAIATGIPTTNTLHLALVAETNSPAPGAFTSLVVNHLLNPNLYGNDVQMHSQNLTVNNLTVEGEYAGALQTDFNDVSNSVETLQEFTNYPVIPTLPIDTSVHSTYGRGAGLIAYSTTGGTNWLNISIATNLWGRILINTNSW